MFDSCKNKCICTVARKKITEGFEAIVLIFEFFFESVYVFALVNMIN
jgi:hypothetical protein